MERAVKPEHLLQTLLIDIPSLRQIGRLIKVKQLLLNILEEVLKQRNCDVLGRKDRAKEG